MLYEEGKKGVSFPKHRPSEGGFKRRTGRVCDFNAVSEGGVVQGLYLTCT